MFDGFTDRAKRVMGTARTVALEWRHDWIGPEHILAGLLEGDGVAANVLRNRGCDLAALRGRLAERASLGRKPVTASQLPFTPAGKRLLERALETAGDLLHNYVGTEHLLLGLMRLDGGPAHALLLEQGLAFDSLRADVLAFLGGSEPEDGAQWRKQRAHALRQLRNGRGIAVVVAPPDAALTRLHDAAIAPALRDAGIEDVRRIEFDLSTMALTEESCDWLLRAELVVTVLTAHHPEVFYAVGLCHGFMRAPIVLAERAVLPTGAPWFELDLTADPASLRERLAAVVREVRSADAEED